jgi:hypothetical protein
MPRKQNLDKRGQVPTAPPQPADWAAEFDADFDWDGSPLPAPVPAPAAPGPNVGQVRKPGKH